MMFATRALSTVGGASGAAPPLPAGPDRGRASKLGQGRKLGTEPPQFAALWQLVYTSNLLITFLLS